MTFISKAILFALVTAAALAQTGDPWTKPREISTFQFLLDRSPFSLPTAEESSPLADRYSLTGAVALDGEPLVFLLDKTTQTRQMVSKKMNQQNIQLVEYLPDPDPRHMRATIRVNGELATIAYAEAAGQAPQPAGPQPNGMPPKPPSAVVSAPAVPNAMPGSPAIQQPGATPPAHRIIRRRIISDQPAPGP
ncbi:MAG: hypothetical protein D4R65_03810 [Verrucomicrobiaceae bacterium]|nr:MAG: hypothetical protein D4R65_03810 [Verrucomicrobiaceae bacterium]